MRTLCLSVLLLAALVVRAGDPTDSLKREQAAMAEQLRAVDSIEKSLHYKTGTVVVGSNLATLNLPAGFKFLDSTEARLIIEDIWGNPKGQKALGLIVPANTGAVLADYAFVVEYEAMGFVKDDDADKINYDDLLIELKKDAVAGNEERKRLGMESMDLVGWAAKPYYNKEQKILYWAKEFKVEGKEENTLNYDIRVLGRRGVLVLQAVSGMSQIDSVNKQIPSIIAMAQFNQGERYADFDSKTDDIAAWTIGGLVAGKVLAKAGFFAVIMKFLKFIIAGVVLAGGAIFRFFTGRKKQEEEPAYEPATPAVPQEEPAQ
ncbi:DUF2167 domain-containing protein [Flaviaesturariibacter amylovorans]|uniref:DUF2167 domain-containing protein n=1 Tax=Flaviaesturariibacter amylovorans TaxID=1084520 RepID=A0ABP8GHA3_9BACT